MFLGACESLYTPSYAFTHNYSDSELRLAEQYVTSIKIVSWRNMGGNLADVNIGGYMRISDEQLGDHYFNSYKHELAHLYEYHVLGMTWEDTGNHKGWTPHR